MIIIGYVCSCVGPIIDIQLRAIRYICERIALSVFFRIILFTRDIFQFSMYDSIIVIRSLFYFRDGVSLATLSLYHLYIFTAQLYLCDSVCSAVLRLLSLIYGLFIHPLVYIEGSQTYFIGCIIVGFASILSLIRRYSNTLIIEIHQLCYANIIRSVALCVTEGLDSWRCSCLILLQSLALPVGKITLGRIINVVGSVIDCFLDLNICRQYYLDALALLTYNVSLLNLFIVEPFTSFMLYIEYPHMKESTRFIFTQQTIGSIY